MKKGIYIFSALIVACIFISCAKIESENSISDSNSRELDTTDLERESQLTQEETRPIKKIYYPKEHDHLKYNTDSGYKIFYGEWVVTKLIGENSKFTTPDVNDIIGKSLFLTAWECRYYYDGEEYKLDYPEFDITLIPLDENTAYFPNMPTLNEIGITGNYAILVYVSGGKDMHFMVKDDETLIMFYMENYLELKRTAYLESHEVYYNAF